MWTMLGWLSWAASLASSMNMLMKSALPVMYGRIFLIATVFWNPSTPRMRAFHTSAIPPTAMRSSSVYWPNFSPAGSGASRGTIWMRWAAIELSPPGSTPAGGVGGAGATRGAPGAEDAAGGIAGLGEAEGAGAWDASPGRDDGSTFRPAFASSSISERAIAPVIRRRTPVDSAEVGGAGGGPAGGGGAGRTGPGPAAAVGAANAAAAADVAAAAAAAPAAGGVAGAPAPALGGVAFAGRDPAPAGGESAGGAAAGGRA